jgi:PhzF family phenazine biosynthesis protein
MRLPLHPEMRLPLYQIDAFATEVFAGNPAAVCPLQEWLPEGVMQAIAAENNLSETAFFAREGEAFGLRWFTPVSEVDLCGHATLASAYVVFRFLEPKRRSVAFRTREAGTLTVARAGDDRLAMDFPARPARPCDMPEGLVAALGRAPVELHVARDYLALFNSADEVRALSPDFAGLLRLGRSLIVTAPGDEGCDFVSRFFAPDKGINEDPVTGSAHCTLAPFWAARLGRNELRARQVSARGGEMNCILRGERVTLEGSAVLYLEGTITL